MLLEVYNAIKPLILNPSVRMVVLYRIDGTPIIAEVKTKSPRFLNILYHLENHIKNILYEIFNGNLEDVSFKFRDVVIGMYPVSRTLVLTVMTRDEVSMYKLEVDIKSICGKIRELV